jgi:hypothetical protein
MLMTSSGLVPMAMPARLPLVRALALAWASPEGFARHQQPMRQGARASSDQLAAAPQTLAVRPVLPEAVQCSPAGSPWPCSAPVQVRHSATRWLAPSLRRLPTDLAPGSQRPPARTILELRSQTKRRVPVAAAATEVARLARDSRSRSLHAPRARSPVAEVRPAVSRAADLG